MNAKLSRKDKRDLFVTLSTVIAIATNEGLLRYSLMSPSLNGPIIHKTTSGLDSGLVTSLFGRSVSNRKPSVEDIFSSDALCHTNFCSNVF